MSNRLYMAVHVYDEVEEVPDEFGIYPSDYVHPQPAPEPAGWREYALERWPDGPREGEHWPNGYQPFFFPKTDVPYKSRSTAQYRVDIINRWGGRAVVVECTPHWETVSAANARRANARLLKRIEKKQLELMRLEALVGEVAS